MGIRQPGPSPPAWAGRERAASPGQGQHFEGGDDGSLITSHPRGRRPLTPFRDRERVPHPCWDALLTPEGAADPLLQRGGGPPWAAPALPTPEDVGPHSQPRSHKRSIRAAPRAHNNQEPTPPAAPSPRPCLREVTGKKLGWKPSW